MTKDTIICPIPPLDMDAAYAAQQCLDSLAKLPGSLGLLEDLAVQLAAMTAKEQPTFVKKRVVLFAGDHHIAKSGVSASDSAVTIMQVYNFLRGGGCINSYCRNANADLVIVDAGIQEDLPHEPDIAHLVRRKVIYGAKDFSQEAAMTRQEAVACVQLGINMAHEAAKDGVTLLAAGEMGIGNTSPSSAIVSVMTKRPLSEVTGKGGGLDNEGVKRKIAVIQRGLDLHKPDPNDGLDVLAKVGGAEIGAMAGLMLGGAALRIPVVIDGFIAGAAALIAAGINKDVCNMLVGSHQSAEAGHDITMQMLGIKTYLPLGLRLGEGTGAALMFPIIDASVRILSEMVSLDKMENFR